MARRLAILLAFALIIGACGEGDAIFDTAPDSTTASTVLVEQTPFDVVVDIVLNLPEDDVFVLLDSLDDDDYSALLDEVGVEGDAEFVEMLNFASASLLVDAIDDNLFDDLVALGNVGVDPDIESPVAEPGGTGSPSVAVTAADVRRIDSGALGLKGRVLVEIGPGDISFLAFAKSSDTEAQVFVTGVTSPSGIDVGDQIGLEYGELSNFGEAAFYAPLVEAHDLEIGVYEIAFEATEEIVDSGAFVRSGSVDGVQALDVVFWMATNEQYDRSALEARFRDVAADVLGPHGISVGVMTFIDPPQAIVDEYAVLDFKSYGDADLRGLCREMSSSVGALRALNFAIVDRLAGGGADAIIEGSSSGLPGTVLLSDSGLSCVAGMASPDPDDPGRDLFERAIVVWHEAGHHLGLYHTTEEDGLFFDLVADTPECPAAEYDVDGDGFIDLFECEGLDASNFMFYDGDGTWMSQGQAWSIRRHPLLYPIDS
jgi:hypothetical protein